MKFGLVFFPVRPAFLLPMARHADKLGYDSIWMGEHVAFPTAIASQYPYDPTLGPPLPTTPLFDPLITFSYMAAQTQRIQLGTAIYLLPLRHPVVTAKLVATLDTLAGGRIILGVGSGWLQEEFATVDAQWDHRGARMEESIHIMRRLWTEPRVAHQGRFYRFDEIGSEPKPVRAPVPIILGGETSAALKRAARIGDGWIGMDHAPAEAGTLVQELRRMRGNDLRPFETSVQPKILPDVDQVRRYRDAGVDRLIFHARIMSGGQKTQEAALDGLARFAETVMGRVNA